ncbi:MAG: TetM/TetW/TetO/TetS family tetracycline resistance ribosomal protection protein [Clostridia bacterium]|nr:TetM/TetW/TetO/TetS family tetracycline resistance ribosomal protection protein [Clostridia bacterium]
MKKLVAGIVAHVDAGKTTLSESILFATGRIQRPGRVDQGSAHLDTHELEKRRGITIFSSQAVIEIGQTQITLVDTPGHVDFSAEMERALSVLDYAVLVISGTDGVQAHTETLWRLLAQYRIPVFLFITKMDMPNTDRAAVLAGLQQRLHSACLDFTVPDPEQIALCDERALSVFLETGELPNEMITALIRERRLFPCFFGSGLQMTGVDALLRALSDYTIEPPAGNEFAAKVYKVSRDGQNNRLTFMKITGGALKVRAPVSITLPNGEIVEEKVAQIRRYTGEKFETVEQALPGSVYAVLGLTQTRPGQALGAQADGAAPILTPALSYRLLLPEGCDPRTALPKLRLLEEEDPLLHVAWDERAREIRVQLMGQIQTEILKSLLLSRFGLAAEVDEGTVLYKETILAPVEGVGHFEPLRHYAEVHLLLEPLPAGSGLVFRSACHTDDLALNWQRLILTHLKEKEHLGVLIGAPITDLAITLLSGRAHLKHTEGGDFRQATYRAVRQGLMQAQSRLLEPVYRFSLEVPGDCLGRALGDIQRFGGQSDPPQPLGDGMLLRGTAPVSAMRNYMKEVAAYTRGRGRFSCYVEGYQPCRNEEEVCLAAAYNPEHDIENTPDSVFCSHGAGFPVKWHEVPQYMHLPCTLPFQGGGSTH